MLIPASSSALYVISWGSQSPLPLALPCLPLTGSASPCRAVSGTGVGQGSGARLDQEEQIPKLYFRGTGFQGHIGSDPCYHPPDTDYISTEELAQVEQMLAHLTSASAQAAAASLVSGATAASCTPPTYTLAQLHTT